MTKPDCAHCPLAREGQPCNPVHGEGPLTKPKFIIVGESPGVTEERRGRPFIGKSGQIVDRVLRQIGVDRKDVWIDNATLCRPIAVTDKAKKEAAKCCQPRLQATLAQFPGVPVLALGGVSAQSFVGDEFSITQMSGTTQEVDYDGTGRRSVVSSFHPAHILRGGEGVDLLYYLLLYDAAKAKAIGEASSASASSGAFPKTIDYEVEDPDRATLMVLDMVCEGERAGSIACDTETHGVKREVTNLAGVKAIHEHNALEARYAYVDVIGLATPERAVAVKRDLLKPEAEQALKEIFANPAVEKVFHNQLYDRPVLYWDLDIDIKGPIFDTMLAHHAIFPGLPHGLQRVVSQFYRVPPWKSEYRDSGDSWEERAEYCALDTLGTARVKGDLAKLLPKHQKVFDNDTFQADVAFKMHVKGVPIDRSVSQKMHDWFDPLVKSARDHLAEFMTDDEERDAFLDRLAMEQAKIRRKADPADYRSRVAIRKEESEKAWEKGKLEFKPGSTMHISAFLVSHGVPLTQTSSKTGKLSTAKEILESFGDKEAVRTIRNYRTWSKLHKTFVWSMPYYQDAEGRIHPNWSVNKASGRWGASHPMAQNWSVGDEEVWVPNLRRQVKPRPGYVLVDADFEQLEARLVAIQSGDPFLIDVFTRGDDIHSLVASYALPGFDQLEGLRRYKARNLTKNVEYGYFYGAMADMMWKTIVKEKDFAHVKLADVELLRKKLKELMPEVDNWHNRLVRDAMLTGKVTIPIHERRWLFPIEEQIDINFLYNFVCQALAAVLMNEGMKRLVTRLAEEGYSIDDAYPILQVHDSVVVECKEEYAEKVAKIVDESLTQELTIGTVTLNFPAKSEIKESWA